MLKVSIQVGNEISGRYNVSVTTESGRRFFYGFPDGKPRDGMYIRELDPSEIEKLCNGIYANGMNINEDKPCWYETDPVYGQ